MSPWKSRAGKPGDLPELQPTAVGADWDAMTFFDHFAHARGWGVKLPRLDVTLYHHKVAHFLVCKLLISQTLCKRGWPYSNPPARFPG